MSFFEQTKITDNTGNLINPAQDETILLLRRMVKLLESSATVDSANRQKVVVEVMPTTTINNPAVTNIVAQGGNDPRYEFMELAHIAYATNIRSNLAFT